MCSKELCCSSKHLYGMVFLYFVRFIIFYGPQGWVFLFAGFLCFVPGSYHVYYIICTVCGRPGYSFDKLPTFNR
uniref:Uncharacterized protein n=1 Tax=Angiostrongylus cantonensis TaxID=6313 RepID=A0A0K0CV08_ANGCA